MYKFVRCQPHAKYSDLQGWYLVLKPDDVDTLMKLWDGIANFYYRKFGMDPHIIWSDMEMAYNPIILAAQWLCSVEHFLLVGTTLVINHSGGMLPLDSVEVLAEIESERMVWPDCYADEVITISRWPKGQHYYLSSNKTRIFVPFKYVQYESALYAAKKYTNNVESKGC